MAKKISEITTINSSKEVSELISHARRLVIKDTDLADSLETPLSLSSAAQYLAIYFNNDTYPDHLRILEAIESTNEQQTKIQILSFIEEKYSSKTSINASLVLSRIANEIPTIGDIQNDINSIRQIIKDTYVDKNPYYKNLKDKYGIDPGISRTAEDFDIIFNPQSVNYITKEFSFEYAKARRYFVSVLYTKSLTKDAVINKEEIFIENGVETTRTVAFNTYKAMCRFFICNMAIIECLHTKIKKPFDLDYITAEDIDQLLFSFGFSEFSDFPMIYKKRIVDSLNRLITKKGTDACFVDILKIFDYKGISIFKYHLVNKFSTKNDGLSIPLIESSPRFLSYDSSKYQSLTKAIKADDVREETFDSVTASDTTWFATKEEVSASSISEIQTKYISIATSADLMSNILSTSFFINMINEIKLKYPGKIDLNVTSSQFNYQPIPLDVAIVALQTMICDFNGLEDNIIFSTSGIDTIYNFNLNEGKDLEYGIAPKKKLLSLKNIDDFSKIDITALADFQNNNSKAYYNFEDFVYTESKKPGMTLEVLNELKVAFKTRFTSTLNLSKYAGYTRYSEWVSDNHSLLGEYLNNFFLITDINTKRDKINYLIQILSDYTYTCNVKFEKLFLDDVIFYLRKIINVFKSYTTTLQDIDIVYMWNEKLFFSYIDKYSLYAKFNMKLFLYFGTEYIFKAQENCLDNLLLLEGKHNLFASFKGYGNFSKLSDKQKSRGYRSQIESFYAADNLNSFAYLGASSRFYHNDKLMSYTCPGTSHTFVTDFVIWDSARFTYTNDLKESMYTSDNIGSTYGNIFISTKILLSDRFVIKTLI